MPRLSAPVAVVVSAALLASVGAGSYAAGSLVTSKQIKDGTIKVEDLSPKAVERLQGADGPTGTRGAAGPAGPAGTTGARGASAWDRIPSKQTVTGKETMIFTATAANQVATAMISLPALPSEPLVLKQNVFFGPTGPLSPFGGDNPACSGTSAAPTAPPGMLCVYVTGSNVWTYFSAPSWSSEKDVAVTASSMGSGSVSSSLSWAYTAP